MTKDTPDRGIVSRNLTGLWVKCPAADCGKTVYKKDVDGALGVCPECSYHFRMSARARIRVLLDPDSFREIDPHMGPRDPLDFGEGASSYQGKLRRDAERTGSLDACLIGRGLLGGHHLMLAVTDSFFLMGSMGSVVGEKVTRAAELARAEHLPLIAVSGSGGGARMQEGAISLMQMAKTSAAIQRLQVDGGLFISVLTHPTMGGVMASFAALGDVILAEPRAMLGFAGRRVIEQTIKRELPPGFQTAEFCLEHGFIDRIVHRKELRETLKRILDYLVPQPADVPASTAS
jgi:acetyl-CoA carboxylase carboxyl transferase subunit beta